LDSSFLLFFLVGWDSPLGTMVTTGLLYQPQMIDYGDCGATGGMKIGRGNRSTRRKSASAPLCPLQIAHDKTRARTRAAAMGSQRLTAWAMARPLDGSYCGCYFRLARFNFIFHLFMAGCNFVYIGVRSFSGSLLFVLGCFMSLLLALLWRLQDVPSFVPVL
jgi:hypothetical protein